jgi:hypothetical protein
VKGFLNVAGCLRPVVVHVVQQLTHPPVELAPRRDASRKSRLVFIPQHSGAPGARPGDVGACIGGRRWLAQPDMTPRTRTAAVTLRDSGFI